MTHQCASPDMASFFCEKEVVNRLTSPLHPQKLNSILFSKEFRNYQNTNQNVMFIHFHAASLPSWFFMFGKSSGHCCKTHHFLWSTLSAIWFNPLQVSKRASPVHHEQLPVLSNHLPQKRWRAFSTHSWLTKALEHQKCTVTTASWILPSTWDQLRIVTSKSKRYATQSVKISSSCTIFWFLHQKSTLCRPRLTSSMSTTFWVPTTCASSILPWAATIFLSMGEKHPSTSLRIYNKFMYRLILTLLNLYYSSVVKSS